MMKLLPGVHHAEVLITGKGSEVEERIFTVKNKYQLLVWHLKESNRHLFSAE